MCIYITYCLRSIAIAMLSLLKCAARLRASPKHPPDFLKIFNAGNHQCSVAQIVCGFHICLSMGHS